MTGAVTGRAGLAGRTLTQILVIVTLKNKFLMMQKNDTHIIKVKKKKAVVHVEDLAGGRQYCGPECIHTTLIS